MTDTGSSPAFAPLPGRRGTPIPIPGSSVRIGQGLQNEVVIDDDTVSTSHARLEYADGVWRLSDLGSRNGTFVNGQRLESGATAELSDGVPVAFGGVKLIFSPGSGLPAPAPTPAPEKTVSAPTTPGTTTGPGFRLPVWVLLLIILVIAVIIAIVVLVGGPADAAAAGLEQVVMLLGFQPDPGVL